jgi:hypothetical protein
MQTYNPPADLLSHFTASEMSYSCFSVLKEGIHIDLVRDLLQREVTSESVQFSFKVFVENSRFWVDNPCELLGTALRFWSAVIFDLFGEIAAGFENCSLLLLADASEVDLADAQSLVG